MGQKPTVAQLTHLAHAITATLEGPREHTHLRELAAKLCSDVAPHAPSAMTDTKFKMAFVSMNKAAAKARAELIQAIHGRPVGAPIGRTSTSQAQGGASRPAPSAPTARRQSTSAEATGLPRKIAAEKRAALLEQRATAQAAKDSARAAEAHARVARRAAGSGAAARTTAATDAGAHAAAPAGAAPAPTGAGRSPSPPGRGPGLLQRLRTQTAVAFAGREGRRAEAALPEVSRKLDKRAGETQRLQAGIGALGTEAHGDVEAEYAALHARTHGR